LPLADASGELDFHLAHCSADWDWNRLVLAGENPEVKPHFLLMPVWRHTQNHARDPNSFFGNKIEKAYLP